MKRALQAAVVASVVLGCLQVAAAEEAADPVTTMQQGRDLFERSCKNCHGLDRSLAPPARDAAHWTALVKRMVAYGAPLKAEQRPLVVRYLATRSVFAEKCGRCHEATRVVGDTPGSRNWKELTERMAEHVRELETQGKAPAGAPFTPEELSDIAAMLQVVIP